MVKLTKKSRDFLLENNLNFLMLLESIDNKGQEGQSNPEEATQDTSLNSDDEPNYSKTENRAQEQAAGPTEPTEPNAQEGQEEQGDEAATSPEELPTIDEIIQQNIDIADQKYVQFRLFDKINELKELINTSDVILFYTEEEKKELLNFKNYLDILLELLFVFDINSVYQLLGQIEIDLINFFNQLNERLKILKEKEIEIKNNHAQFDKDYKKNYLNSFSDEPDTDSEYKITGE
jgi:hypothetical protein